MNKSNILLLLFICLSYTTVTDAKHSPGVGQYFDSVGYYALDSSDKDDQVDDDNGVVQRTGFHFDQSKSTNLIQYQASYYLGYAFVRPLTRAPPNITT